MEESIEAQKYEFNFPILVFYGKSNPTQKHHALVFNDHTFKQSYVLTTNDGNK